MKGFTLVELLVSIAIVGILTSLGLAHLEVYRRQANDILAISQVQNLINASEARIIDTAGQSGYLAFTVSPNGTDLLNAWELLPGFVHYEGVGFYMDFDKDYARIWAAHCKGTIVKDDGSDLYGDTTKIFFYRSDDTGKIITTRNSFFSLSPNGGDCNSDQIVG